MKITSYFTVIYRNYRKLLPLSHRNVTNHRKLRGNPGVEWVVPPKVIPATLPLIPAILPLLALMDSMAGIIN